MSRVSAMSSAARPRLAAALVERDKGSGVHDLIEVTDLTEPTAAGPEVDSAAAEVSALSEALAATTTEQGAAVTDQVGTMEQLTQASRHVSATAQQIAAAALLASLSVNLKATADIRRHRTDA